MKKLSFVPILIALSALTFFMDEDSHSFTSRVFNSDGLYKQGILNTEYNKVNRIANYNIDADFDPVQKKIFVKEEILWVNKTRFSTKEIQLHLYANAYESTKTLFGKTFALNRESMTRLEISKCIAEGEEKQLIYFQPEVANPYDNTVAKILLKNNAGPGDTVKIYFEYSMKIPRSVRRLGYATGRNFFMVSQWFPKVGVFENGKWICSQYHPYLNFYSDFGDYNVTVTTPTNYKLASTGVITGAAQLAGKKKWSITQSGVHDFAWVATDEIVEKNEIYKRADGSQINIIAFVQQEREKYLERYFKVVKDCLRYFEERIGIYPYQNITLVDVPRTSASGGMEYPTLFTVSAELFARKDTGWPEYLVAHEFSHQYFHGLLANNEVYEAWLDEGFTSYIATKIMFKYHKPILENFKVAQYIPIFGLNFLSYRDIPIIYTLADVPITEGTRSIVNYYKNLNVGKLADTSYTLPNRLSYVVNSYNKPELVLLTLERYLGEQKFMSILRDYYNKFKYKHPTAKDFINVVDENVREDMSWFFNDFYNSSKSFDYRVTSLTQISETEYEVLVERLGDGFYRTDVVLYTDKNTLTRSWDGIDKWKIFRFNTLNTVIAAEVDPERKNLLDINFANNSYTVEENTVAALSLANRWFFWVQNALMILGSIG